jgi:hypothetical protein
MASLPRPQFLSSPARHSERANKHLAFGRSRMNWGEATISTIFVARASRPCSEPTGKMPVLLLLADYQIARVAAVRQRREAREEQAWVDRGIAIVHQKLAFCPHLSVAENLCLGDLSRRAGFVDRPPRPRRGPHTAGQERASYHPHDNIRLSFVPRQPKPNTSGKAAPNSRAPSSPFFRVAHRGTPSAPQPFVGQHLVLGGACIEDNILIPPGRPKISPPRFRRRPKSDRIESGTKTAADSLRRPGDLKRYFLSEKFGRLQCGFYGAVRPFPFRRRTAMIPPSIATPASA